MIVCLQVDYALWLMSFRQVEVAAYHTVDNFYSADCLCSLNYRYFHNFHYLFNCFNDAKYVYWIIFFSDFLQLSRLSYNKYKFVPIVVVRICTYDKILFRRTIYFHRRTVLILRRLLPLHLWGFTTIVIRIILAILLFISNINLLNPFITVATARVKICFTIRIWLHFVTIPAIIYIIISIIITLYIFLTVHILIIILIIVVISIISILIGLIFFNEILKSHSKWIYLLIYYIFLRSLTVLIIIVGDVAVSIICWILLVAIWVWIAPIWIIFVPVLSSYSIPSLIIVHLLSIVIWIRRVLYWILLNVFIILLWWSLWKICRVFLFI